MKELDGELIVICGLEVSSSLLMKLLEENSYFIQTAFMATVDSFLQKSQASPVTNNGFSLILTRTMLSTSFCLQVDKKGLIKQCL